MTSASPHRRFEIVGDRAGEALRARAQRPAARAPAGRWFQTATSAIGAALRVRARQKRRQRAGADDQQALRVARGRENAPRAPRRRRCAKASAACRPSPRAARRCARLQHIEAVHRGQSARCVVGKDVDDFRAEISARAACAASSRPASAIASPSAAPGSLDGVMMARRGDEAAAKRLGERVDQRWKIEALVEVVGGDQPHGGRASCRRCERTAGRTSRRAPARLRPARAARRPRRGSGAPRGDSGPGASQVAAAPPTDADDQRSAIRTRNSGAAIAKAGNVAGNEGIEGNA